MIQSISITSYLQQRSSFVLLDVRTPLEYEKGHIPGAKNLPIFSNEDRVQIGTTYKQKGKEEAILLGLERTGPKWRSFVEEALLLAPEKKVAVHCWRGGMRSAAMGWVLDFYGFDVTIITGGYKSYRKWALNQFEKDYPLVILGGLTGSHKTEVLHAMQQLGKQVIDLEGLAHHHGSAYGSLHQLTQPSQEAFENRLAFALYNTDPSAPIWIEDESRMIGQRILPEHLFLQIRERNVIQLILPQEERIRFLTKEYGTLDKAFLIEKTTRIQKRLGPQHAKAAIEAIKNNEMENFIATVLVYYDKSYKKGLSKREEGTVFPLKTDYSSAVECAKTILQFAKKININEHKRN